LPRLLKYEFDKPAKPGGLMFQVVDIELSVGLSAKKREAIFPWHNASRSIQNAVGENGTAKQSEIFLRSSRTV